MPPTCQQFQVRLRDSGIMTAEELEAFASGVPLSTAEDDAHTLAQALVDAQRLTPFQAEVLLADAARPLRLGNYLLLDRVGSGGMGHVHKAVHERMNRVVALKLLPPMAALDEGLVSRFRREVQVAAKLHHPNIVTAYDADEADGVHFLVMELVEGRDLGQVVTEDGPLAWDVALDTIRQAAEGLAYAHREGVLHRDVKPANLLVDEAGTVKVLDMGLARLDASEGLTTTGEFLGTAATMAPEQGEDLRLVDERSDVYGLGCTLYYLLTGRHVYAGESAVQMLLAHASQPVPRLRDACPDLPPSVEYLFESMVQKDKADRPADMPAVLEAIQAIREGEAPELPPVAPASDPLPAHSRRRWVGAAAALVVVAVVAVLLATRSGTDGGGNGAADARAAALAGPLIRTLRGHQGAVHGVAVHPDGRRILSASGDGTIGVWNRDSGELVDRLYGHADSVRSVLCLADGKTAVSSSDDASIRIWDLTRSETTKVLTGHEAKVRQLALAPDESFVASVSKDGTLRLWDLPEGKERLQGSEHGAWVGDNRGFLSVAIHPEGTVLATTAFDRMVRLWDASSLGVRQALGPHASDVGFIAFGRDGSHLLYDVNGGEVRVMGADAREEICRLIGHEDWVYALACAHHAPVVATGSQDTTIRLWNYRTGRLLATLKGHEYTVGALAFTADDAVLVSGAGDETVRLWDVSRITQASD